MRFPDSRPPDAGPSNLALFGGVFVVLCGMLFLAGGADPERLLDSPTALLIPPVLVVVVAGVVTFVLRRVFAPDPAGS